MLSPEEQQLQICLLKSNLEEIENDIIVKRSTIPSLDEENEQKYHKTLNALQVSRSLDTEIERLKLENIQLTAKRMQLKRQSEEFSVALEKAREERRLLDDSMKDIWRASEEEIRNYEDRLSDIAQRFRQSRAFVIEEEINNDIEMMTNITRELEAEERRRQRDGTRLSCEIGGMRSRVPGNILQIVGKQDMDEKLKSLSEEISALTQKKEHLLKCRTNMANFLTGIP